MPWGIAAAGIGLVGSYMSSQSQKDAAETAANAQTNASQLGIDEQRREFDLGSQEQRDRFNQVQALLAPYANAGNGAISGQQDLLGLNGMGAQQGAINGIQGSPQFGALAKQGEDAILANASATGGLRGGNVQGALAQFRPQLLSQLIDQQYQRLGSVASLGQNAAAGTGNASLQTGQSIASLGASMGNNITGLLGQQGAAQAGAALADGRANSQFINGVSNSFGSLMGGGGLSGLFGPSTGAASGHVDNTLF